MVDTVQSKLDMVCTYHMEMKLPFQVSYFLLCFLSQLAASSTSHFVHATVCSNFQQDHQIKTSSAALRHRNFCGFHKLSPFFQLRALDELLSTNLSPSLFSERIQLYRCMTVSCYCASLLLPLFPCSHIFIFLTQYLPFLHFAPFAGFPSDCFTHPV